MLSSDKPPNCSRDAPQKQILDSSVTSFGAWLNTVSVMKNYYSMSKRASRRKQLVTVWKPWCKFIRHIKGIT